MGEVLTEGSWKFENGCWRRFHGLRCLDMAPAIVSTSEESQLAFGTLLGSGNLNLFSGCWVPCIECPVWKLCGAVALCYTLTPVTIPTVSDQGILVLATVWVNCPFSHVL
jgi:hypothetical protein